MVSESSLGHVILSICFLHIFYTKKYYKSKYCFSLHLPKDLEEKVKDAAESEARNVTSYITSLILKDLKEKELLK